MSKWQKEVCTMRVNRQSESELIHSLRKNRKSESHLIHSQTSPKHALRGADAPHRTRTRYRPQTRRLARLWGCGAA